MAITDILARIEGDAAADAAEIVAAAEAEAARIVSTAEATVAAEWEAALEAADRNAAEEAATLLAGARLAARDSLLAAKRDLAERVLERAREALETLPDAAYLELIGDAVEAAVRGGESVAIASVDAARLAGLGQRLGSRIPVSTEPAPIERGALLAGDRVRVEVSPAALIADRHEELLHVAVRALFDGQR